MKPKRHLTQLFLVTLFFVISNTCFAQIQEFIPEENPPEQTIEMTSHSEGEEKAPKVTLHTPVEKDTVIQVNQNKAKRNPDSVKSEKIKNESDDDDSVLSFNFIYYIIKKFKFSDIIDH